jgi:hypothetical protein
MTVSPSNRRAALISTRKARTGSPRPWARHGWRVSHGMTQAAAAEALGISERGIRLYENGSQPIPKTITLATRGYDAVAAE